MADALLDHKTTTALKLVCAGDNEKVVGCHTGRKSCFFQKLNGNNWASVAEVLKDPKEIYG